LRRVAVAAGAAAAVGAAFLSDAATFANTRDAEPGGTDAAGTRSAVDCCRGLAAANQVADVRRTLVLVFAEAVVDRMEASETYIAAIRGAGVFVVHLAIAVSYVGGNGLSTHGQPLVQRDFLVKVADPILGRDHFGRGPRQ